MSDLGPDARSLIDGALRGDDPSDNDRRRVRAALAMRLAAGAAVVGAGVVASKSAAAAAASKGAVAVGAGTFAASAGKVVVLSALTVVLTYGGAASMGVAPSPGELFAPSRAHVGAAAFARRNSQPPLAPSAQASAVPTLVEAPAPPIELAAAPSPRAPVTHAAARVPMPSVAPASTPPAASAPSPATVEIPAVGGSLPAELALLREAHAAVAAGNAPRAIELLDEHARRFPDGALVEERSATRVFALCNAGRGSAARSEAERFGRVFPRSPYAARVRAACADPAADGP